MKINDKSSLTQSLENVYFQNELYPDKGLVSTSVYDTILQQNYFFTKTEVNRKRSAKWLMKPYLITPYSLCSRSSLATEVLVSSRSFLRTHTSDIHLCSPKSTPWLLCSSLSLLPLLMPFPYLSVSLCLE